MDNIIQPYLDIIFPETCVCCGQSLEKQGQNLCNWCSEERFNKAEQEVNEFLPEHILFRFSLWEFDKGGVLQELLHQLKYQNMKLTGEELGRIAGRAFLKSSVQKNIDFKRPVLVPVPLHPAKKRKRGYNQARAIATGVAEVLCWDLIQPGVIVRTRKTKTQTGLNSGQRSKNVKNSFKVKHSEWMQQAFPVIVDDVFTTGATTFELAAELNRIAPVTCGVLTVAKA